MLDVKQCPWPLPAAGVASRTTSPNSVVTTKMISRHYGMCPGCRISLATNGASGLWGARVLGKEQGTQQR